MVKKCSQCGTVNDDLVPFCIECDSNDFENIICENSDDILEKTKILANKGNINAQFFIGKICFFGMYGFKKNIEKARDCFDKASKQGHLEAQVYLKKCEEIIEQRKKEEDRENEEQKNKIEENRDSDITEEKTDNIEEKMLSQNQKNFPAFICKNCESIIPLNELSINSHRTIQIYGTSLLDTIGKQYVFDALLSEKHPACPHCGFENLISLGTPLAETLIKKHLDNEQYKSVLFSDPIDIVEKYNMKVKKHQNSGCYIATAIYKSYDCPEVWTLRRFRDNILLENIIGKLFVKIYYFLSPTIVKYFGRTRIFNMLFKTTLDKFVAYLNNNGFKNTQYKDKI